jgi:hypothetical protein
MASSDAIAIGLVIAVIFVILFAIFGKEEGAKGSGKGATPSFAANPCVGAFPDSLAARVDAVVLQRSVHLGP